MSGWLAMAARPALLLLGLVAAGFVLRRLGLDGAIEHAGERGPAVFTLLAAIACAVGVPRQVVAYSAGLAFGFWPGLGFALAAELAGCAADFFWARLVARRWAAAFIARSMARGGRVARMERFLVDNAFSATLTLRPLPVGSNIVLNLLAGVSAVAAAPFLAASLLGYVPQTVVFVLLGGGVRVAEGVQMGLAVGLFAASVGLGVLLLRRRPVPGLAS